MYTHSTACFKYVKRTALLIFGLIVICILLCHSHRSGLHDQKSAKVSFHTLESVGGWDSNHCTGVNNNEVEIV